MPAFADEVIYLRQIATPADATGKYLEVIVAPPGKGVNDARVDDGSNKVVYDAIVRASIADCTGDPAYINWLDGGFP